MERTEFIVNYGMGFHLKPIHYIVKKDEKRCCVLKISENVKDCDFAIRMKTANGEELYEWLELGRSSIRREPEKFAVPCSDDCKGCKLHDDFYKRLLTIETKKVGENSYEA